jgi:hypothetical protein
MLNYADKLNDDNSAYKKCFQHKTHTNYLCFINN